jgi:hemoglobin/transferrin/lactoferrin receptor protein
MPQFLPFSLAALTLLPCLAVQAQEQTSNVDVQIIPMPMPLSEFVISANKFNENKRNVVQSILVIDNKVVTRSNPQTSADMLQQTGNVFVQKSQLGGGSPVLRGFEANRVQLVIDGVRMNNAIYRAGHLQNAITIDPNMLERTEVMFGPASTLYGSDAIGGVVVFESRRPKLSENGSFTAGANAMVRYSTANQEKTGHADINLGWKKWASLTSFTYSDFDDLVQGNNRSAAYPDFGKRPQYVVRANGRDSVVNNSNINKQVYSGYNQVDVLQKLLFRPNNRVMHTLNLQYSHSSDIPRYDRLTDMRNGQLRYADWFYGPQDRLMAAYQLHTTSLHGFFNEMKVGVNYQHLEESRNDRELNKNYLNHRLEKVDVVGFSVDGIKRFGQQELSLGMDGQLNLVNSTASQQSMAEGGADLPLATRYPDGKNNMTLLGLYAQHIWKIKPNKLVLNDGLRVSYVGLNSQFKDTSLTHFPFSFGTVQQNNVALSGNLGLVYMPVRPLRIHAGVSTGFRAPNIDDVGKTFDSRAGEQLLVPNANLRPEYSYNADLGFTALAWGERIKLDVTGFYTLLRNAIVVDRYNYNGQDSVMYEGKMTAITAAQNKARAYVYGVSGSLIVEPMRGLKWYSTINYTRGRFQNANGSEVPMDHIPPVFGKSSVSYLWRKLTTEAYVQFNGWKRIADYNPYGEDNERYATKDGMPSWYTLNLRAGYQITPKISVNAALENILDRNYRYFASGISAPGRNLVLALRAGI